MGGAINTKNMLIVLPHKFAFKCSYVEIDGEPRDVFKDPITDKGKTSKKGKLALIKDSDGQIKTMLLNLMFQKMKIY